MERQFGAANYLIIFLILCFSTAHSYAEPRKVYYCASSGADFGYHATFDGLCDAMGEPDRHGVCGRWDDHDIGLHCGNNHFCNSNQCNHYKSDEIYCDVGQGIDINTGLCEDEEDDDDKDCSKPATSHPISLDTGVKRLREVDLTAPLGSPLSVVRNYSSSPNALAHKGNGGWAFPFSGEIKTRVFTSVGPYAASSKTYKIYIQVIRDDIRISNYLAVTPSLPNPVVEADLDTLDFYPQSPKNSKTLNYNLSISRWELTNSDDAIEYYSLPSNGLQLTMNYMQINKFTGIKMREGGGYTVDYQNGTDNIDTVTDHLGHTLTYYYYSGTNDIEFIVSSWGEVAHYLYDSDHRISQVGIGSDMNNLTSFVYKTYSYGSWDELEGLVDENGDRYLTWSYTWTSDFSKRWANRSYLGAGVGQTSINYTDVNTVSVTNALGKETIYHWQHNPRRAITDWVEGVASASGDCAAANQDLGYDASGYINLKTDWKGNKTYYTNDTKGLPLVVEKEDINTAQIQRRTTNEWHSALRLKTKETIAGLNAINALENLVQTDWIYTNAGRLNVRTVTDLTTYTTPYTSNGNTQIWSYSYTYWDVDETQIQTMTVDGPRTDVSDVMVYEYNQQGFLTKTTNALGQVTEVLEHSPHGYPAKVIDANNVETRMTYHFRGWLETVTVENGTNDAVTTMAYDNVGQIVEITLPNGSSLHYDYDSAHRLYKVTDNTGAAIEYTLDAAGNRTAEIIKDNTGTLAKSQTQVFDELSRLRESIGASSQSEAYGYDANDNLTAVTDGKSQTSTSSYDALDRLLQQTDPDNFNANYTYDAEGRITSLKDQRNLITTYQYDGLGNLMQAVSPDTGTTTYSYDSVGNRTNQTDARGVVTLYTYDALNRLATVSYPANPAENVTYAYDDATSGINGIGRLTGITDESGSTSYTYDFLGNVVTKDSNISGVGYGIQYSYDLTGNITQIIYPSGRLVDYSYDSLGRISGITTKANAGANIEIVVSNVTYLPFGPVSGYTYGNGLVQILNYDQDYRLIANQSQGTTDPLNLGYSYDLNNNIATITDQLNSGNNQAFQYDSVDRLELATGQYGQLDYQYDGVGNRIQQIITEGVDTTTETYGYSTASNQLDQVSRDDSSTQTQRSFQYDARGNLILQTEADGTVDSYGYNEAGRYVQLDKATALRALYGYNAFGQRTSKTAVGGGGATITDHYHYDESGRLLAVSTTTGVPKREIIYLGGIQVAVLIDDAFATEWDGFEGGADSDADGIPDNSDNCPNDPNPNQTDADADTIGNVCDSLQLTVSSIGTEDGWTRESGENTDVGGKKNNTGTGSKAIRFGDYRNNRQYKAILSFDLTAIPVGSALTAANLQLTRTNGSLVGDTSALGTNSIDLKVGAFNDNSALENADFQASATQANVGTIVDGLTATAAINSGGVAAIQTAKNGGENKIQLRVQYSVDDDNDSTDDYTSYYSGSTSNAIRHPQLIVDYTLAD